MNGLVCGYTGFCSTNIWLEIMLYTAVLFCRLKFAVIQAKCRGKHLLRWPEQTYYLHVFYMFAMVNVYG